MLCCTLSHILNTSVLASPGNRDSISHLSRRTIAFDYGRLAVTATWVTKTLDPGSGVRDLQFRPSGLLVERDSRYSGQEQENSMRPCSTPSQHVCWYKLIRSFLSMLKATNEVGKGELSEAKGLGRGMTSIDQRYNMFAKIFSTYLYSKTTKPFACTNPRTYHIRLPKA